MLTNFTVAGLLAIALTQSIQTDDARVLATGTIGDRHDALNRIRSVPPEKREPSVWEALASEVDRLMVCHDITSPTPAISAARRCDVSPGAESDYIPDLGEALGATTDPRFIPELVRLAPGLGAASVALARFGDAALPALIESAKGDRTGPWVSEAGGAMFALSEMIRPTRGPATTALSQAGRTRIVATANELMNTKLTTAWIPVVSLALATRDQAIRDVVEKLASDPDEWRRRGVTDQSKLDRMQRSTAGMLRMAEAAK